MTREEAIEVMKAYRDKVINSVSNQLDGDIKAFEMAIQALSQEQISLNDINNALEASFRNGVRSAKVEQEPTVDEMEREYEKSKALFHKIVESDDAISREYLFKVLDDFCGHERTATITLDTLADLVYELPSVTPSRRYGAWIGIDEEPHEDFECCVCGKAIYAIEDLSEYKFCPNCGAEMVEPQEFSQG